MKRFGTFSLFFIVLIPLCLCISTPYGFAQNIQGVQLRTVVIDPGHGGRDPGTVAPGGRYLEKHIVLSIALKLGKLIENAYPDVKVLYTRKTDVAVGLSDRTDFANKNHADLFISIHVNSVERGPAPSGSETHVMGLDWSDSSMEVSKIENSVIAYEDNYITTYQGFDPNNPESYIIFSLMQNAHLEQSVQFAELVQNALGKDPIAGNRGVKQSGMYVLYRTSMPAILVELGFLPNASDRAVLISDNGQQKLANALFTAFRKYKSGYDRPLLHIQQPRDTIIPVASVVQQDTTQKPRNEAATAVYRVQIFAISRLLPFNAPEFKGYSNIHYQKVGNLYKYTTGAFSSREEAQRYCLTVRRDFPQAFVVEDGK